MVVLKPFFLLTLSDIACAGLVVGVVEQVLVLHGVDERLLDHGCSREVGVGEPHADDVRGVAVPLYAWRREHSLDSR